MYKLQEEQGITPPALERKPELTDSQAWRVTEFGKLSRDRRYTESGPMPLDTGTIRTYFDAFKLHDFGFDWFYFWMVTLDDIWLDEVAKKRKKEQAAKKAPAKPRPKKSR